MYTINQRVAHTLGERTPPEIELEVTPEDTHGFARSRLSLYRLSTPMWVTLITALTLMLSSCARDLNNPPTLIGLQDYQLYTNQNFQLEITAQDPDQDFLEFSFELTPTPPTPTETSGGVPTLQTLSNTKAIFNWTPGAADTNRYYLTIRVSDSSDATTEETITLTVSESAMGDQLWVRFVEPRSDATVINLSETPCLEQAVSLESDQLSADELSLTLAPPSPMSATLVSDAPKSYRLSWCPRPEELAVQTNFPFLFRASSTTRALPPVDKRFLVRVRAQTAESCPGAPPVITHQPPADYVGVANIELIVNVSDDIGIKSAPSISYQIGAANATTPSEQGWETALLTSGRDTSQGASQGAWVAVIPPPRAPAGATIFYRFLVNDDDDPSGARCDHSVESELYRVSYRWDPNRVEMSEGLCAPCVDDVQCGAVSDLCVVSASGSVCGQACDHSNACPDGYQCQPVSTIGGVMTTQCVSVNACGSACRADLYEVALPSAPGNNSPSSPTTLSSGFYDQLTICSGDDDYYLVSLREGQGLSARIEFDAERGDLDLEVSNPSVEQRFPTLRSVSSVQPFEEVTVSCVTAETTALVRVYGFEGAQNDYTLSLEVRDVECDREVCYPDSHEGVDGNDDTFNATYASLNVTYEGQICPQDLDYYGLPLTEGVTVNATLEVSGGARDLALDVVDEFGTQLATSTQESPDTYQVTFTPERSDEYYFKVLSLSADANTPYRLSISASSASCVSSDQCAPSEYCDRSGHCVSSACDLACDASQGYACVSPLAGLTPSGMSGLCAPVCDGDADCRSGERCKAFESFTRRCAPAGSGAVAGACTSFSDCADDLICIPTSGGYCATAACFDDFECAPDTLCAPIAGINSCIKRCVTDADCARSDLRCQDFTGGRACAP